MLRGKFVDAFARLEAVVHNTAVQLSLNLPVNAPFSQKLRELKKTRGQFRHPAKLDERIKEMEGVSGMRADIVHSVLAIALIWDGKDERRLLMFQNAGSPAKPPFLISEEELRQAAGRVETLAHQFSQQQLKAPTPAAPASASE